jgi:hypothetical protein
MPKRKLRKLLNLGAFSNYKNLPTYKKTKPQDKENVSNHNIEGMQADSTYRKPLKWTWSLLLWGLRKIERGSINQ